MKRIQISESELRDIIKESVSKILKEDFDNQEQNLAFALLEQLKITLGSSELCSLLASRLAGCIGYKGLIKTLQEIKDIQSPSLEDDDESDIEAEG